MIDSAVIRSNPAGALSALCAALGIAFTPRMLSWDPGPKPFDGIWAPHWYGAVHRSTGFGGAEGPLPDLPAALARLAEMAQPLHDRLAAHALRPLDG